MKKYLLLLFIILSGITFGGIASATLWEYYDEQGSKLPSISKRAIEWANVSDSVYTGSKGQNIVLESYLRSGFLFGATNVPLPEDSYDTYLTTNIGASDSDIFVSVLPTILDSIFTIFSSDGVTVSEKVHCTGHSASPNKLTGCIRGIATAFSNGQIDETVGTGSSHSKNARIAITDNINFTGKALNILYGNQKTSSTDFIIGTGSSTTIRIYYQNTTATGTSAYIDFQDGQLGWSDNGTDTYNFVAGGSGLSASTTRAIGITDSKIHINVSSTGGLEFDTKDAVNRYLQINWGDGIKTDVNGVYVDEAFNYILTGQVSSTGWLEIATTTPPIIGEGTVSTTANIYGVPQADGNNEISESWLPDVYNNLNSASSTSQITISNTTDEFIIASTTISAGTFAVGDVIEFELNISDFDFSAPNVFHATTTLVFGATTIAEVVLDASDYLSAMLDGYGSISGSLYSTGANTQKAVLKMETSSSTISVGGMDTGTGAENVAVDKSLVLKWKFENNNPNFGIVIEDAKFNILKQ